MNKKAREILERLKEYKTPDKNIVSEQFVQTLVVKDFAELLVELAEEANTTARRIIHLTWILAALTAALVAIGFKDVIVKKDVTANTETEKRHTNQQITIPAITNGH